MRYFSFALVLCTGIESNWKSSSLPDNEDVEQERILDWADYTELPLWDGDLSNEESGSGLTNPGEPLTVREYNQILQSPIKRIDGMGKKDTDLQPREGDLSNEESDPREALTIREYNQIWQLPIQRIDGMGKKDTDLQPREGDLSNEESDSGHTNPREALTVQKQNQILQLPIQRVDGKEPEGADSPSQSPTNLQKEQKVLARGGRLFVGRLTDRTTREDLFQVMKQFGEVTFTDVKEHRGFGFVGFADPRSASAVITKSREAGIIIDGSLVAIRPARHGKKGTLWTALNLVQRLQALWEDERDRRFVAERTVAELEKKLQSRPILREDASEQIPKNRRVYIDTPHLEGWTEETILNAMAKFGIMSKVKVSQFFVDFTFPSSTQKLLDVIRGRGFLINGRRVEIRTTGPDGITLHLKRPTRSGKPMQHKKFLPSVAGNTRRSQTGQKQAWTPPRLKGGN